MNNKLTESEFIDLCKKVELYINTEEYKSNITMGAFSTRFHKLYKDYKWEELGKLWNKTKPLEGGVEL